MNEVVADGVVIAGTLFFSKGIGGGGGPGPSPSNASATILTPTWFGGLTTVNEIHARWQIKFDNYEWLLGANICPTNSRFSIQPYIGPKYTHIKQDYTFSYVRNSSPIVSSFIDLGTADQNCQSYFSGFGLQGGFNAGYYLGLGFNHPTLAAA